ncbi:hypothetical protein F4808DRAFT_264407 [Astrocystis sublimbata]|nr:hypothetical protein F4808DRAFT_264407 [Astrocystis sublimbata]
MASLACISCRGRKQRCDRTIPSCMQCVSAQQHCQYPEQSKRGLPAGFLNAIESRLRETELALFYALSELHEGIVERRAYTGLSDPTIELSPHLSKSDTMEMWANRPLGNRTEAKVWYRELDQNRRTRGPLSPACQLDDVQSRTPVESHAKPAPSHDYSMPESQSVTRRRTQSGESNTLTPTEAATHVTIPMASGSSLNTLAGEHVLSARVQVVLESYPNLYF